MDIDNSPNDQQKKANDQQKKAIEQGKIREDEIGLYFECVIDHGEKAIKMHQFVGFVYFYYELDEYNNIKFDSKGYHPVGFCFEIQKRNDFLTHTMWDVTHWKINKQQLFLMNENDDILFKCKTKDENPDFETSIWAIEWVKGEI